MKEHSHTNKERLKSKKSIGLLFEESKAYGKKPIRFIWRLEEAESSKGSIKMLVAVPKRRVKKAVDRNRIKRYIREAYRLNNSDLKCLFKDEKKNCSLGILFIGNSNVTFGAINDSIRDLIDKFPGEYEKFA